MFRFLTRLQTIAILTFMLFAAPYANAVIIYLDHNFQTYGETDTSVNNGNCRSPSLFNGSFISFCTKGNYNMDWKQDLCENGDTPGWDSWTYWFGGHFTFMGETWDKAGTNQDHQGVCVSNAKPPLYPFPGMPKIFLFHDGCTGYPDGNPRKMTKGPNKNWDPHNWGRVFHGACVVHDLCYKAEPNFSNKDQAYCDNQMYFYAKQICYASYERKNGSLFKKNDLEKCLAEANNAYWGLRNFGSEAHYDIFGYYFDWRPSYTVTNYSTGVITTKSGICSYGNHYDVNLKRCTASPAPRCTGGRNYYNGRCYCPYGTDWDGTYCIDPNDPPWPPEPEK